MDGISRYLCSDHARCDDFFISAERNVNIKAWDVAASFFREFVEALEHHFAMEERVLFTAFEQEIGHKSGPTVIMRMEHAQLRELLAQLQSALEEHDADGYLGYSDTLNTMMQQHNLKEESVLYPMADRMLAGREREIVEAMAALEVSA
jgi:hemerythrin-like domain-containing protein